MSFQSYTTISGFAFRTLQSSVYTIDIWSQLSSERRRMFIAHPVDGDRLNMGRGMCQPIVFSSAKTTGLRYQ